MTQTYLSFTVGNELFATKVGAVLEVLQNIKITTVPNTPDYLKGIINFRGNVVAIVESRIKFNLSERVNGSSYAIIVFETVLEKEYCTIGLLVDKVNDVIEIEDELVKSVSFIHSELNTDFLVGVFKHQDKFILLIDEVNILSCNEIISIPELNLE
jgi:purine-binding chemotaxis protein CheW